MCRRVAEGVKFTKCGHFTRMAVPAIVDCSSTRCQKSMDHPENCRACKKHPCKDNWGPDLQKVVEVRDDLCSGCKFQPGTHTRHT